MRAGNEIMKMNWRYQIKGGHAHIRVFVNGALAGDLVLRVDELEQFRREQNAIGVIQFINQTEVAHETH